MYTYIILHIHEQECAELTQKRQNEQQQQQQQHLEATAVEREELKSTAVRLTSALAAKVLQVAHLEGVLVETNDALTAEKQALTAAQAAQEKEMALAFEAQSSKTEEAFLLQVCCSVLQCVAVCLRRCRARLKRPFCCSVLQCAAEIGRAHV